ncbi:MAG TPA: hypothetical protein VFR97_05030 [Capillimicrobium sp.]|nr:hypothetical protein [Capillimicrobium sp.]
MSGQVLHVHDWGRRGRNEPLYCLDHECGVLWPGAVLPEPAHEREGYGHVAHQPGFTARLRAALAEVPDAA